jgi:hypothetical protein
MYAGFIELVSHDPRQGIIFYTLAQEETNKLALQRHDSPPNSSGRLFCSPPSWAPASWASGWRGETSL